jgi:transcription-repair coupling factor (superfamily II helicase)
LEIRGAGNLLGAEQSGHITAVGFDLYCQLLKQSVAGLKGEKVKPRVEVRVALDFLEMNAADESSRRGERSREPDLAGSSGSRGRSPHQASEGRAGNSGLPHTYIAEPHHRIEIYRKLAQATDKPALEALQKELRDRFGPLPPAVELLLAVGELKILASEKNVTSIEVDSDKLKLIRAGDFIQLGGKFPRLTKKEPRARLKEIKRLLLAL